MRELKSNPGSFPVFQYVAGVMAFCLLIVVLAIMMGCQSPVSDKTPSVDTPTTETPEDPPVVQTPDPAPNPEPESPPTIILPPTPSKPEGRKVFVVNSTWDILPMTKLSPSLSRILARSTTMEDYIAAVDAYNASSIDDYLRIYYDRVPAIEDSPVVDVFIVNPETWHRNMELLGIPRTSLVENAAAWRRDSAGQLLFIDHVPPPPVVTPPPSMYAHYAIYEVDNATGDIILEDHCGYLPDESFSGQWITTPESQGGGGWSSVDAYYLTTLHAYQADCNDGLHRVITRQLYTDPTP